MNALIRITTNEQGSQVVSARELHEYLEVKTPLEKWMPRMAEYGFTQDVDYQQLDKIVQIGNGAKRVIVEDYALTLDTAKELSMIQRTEKGKQARQYFIDAEKQLAAQSIPGLPLTPMELLVQQMQGLVVIGQQMVDTQRELAEVKQDVAELKQIRVQAQTELLALPAPTEAMPEMSTESKIIRYVNTYAQAKAMPQPEVWRFIYNKLYYHYRIAVNNYKLNPGESKLQMLKRLGHLDKVYTVASNVLQVTA